MNNREEDFKKSMQQLISYLEGQPIGVPRLRPEKRHHHKCNSCGHIWAHTQEEAAQVDFASEANGGTGDHAHMCPMGCGTESYDKCDSKGRDYFELKLAGLPFDYTV